MAVTLYTYAKLCNSGRLSEEIKAESGITIGEERIETTSSPEETRVYMKAQLSSGEEELLDGLVDAHVNTPLPDDEIKAVSVYEQPTFASKNVGNLSLFNRTHGKAFSLTAGDNLNLDFAVPYNVVKFNGIEIFNAEIGDKANLKVIDTDGVSTPPYFALNLQLNQFGYDVFIQKDFYSRESRYDADLRKDMRIRIDFNSQTTKTVYVNYLLHELK